MIRFFTAFLLSTTVHTGFALAAEFNFSSGISEVTVFPRGAEVTRTATGRLSAGDHVVLIENMPGNIDPESLRVEGISSGEISIGSVDFRQVVANTEDNKDTRRKLEAEIEQLNDEMLAIEQGLKDDQVQRKLLQTLITNSLMPVDGTDSRTAVSAQTLDDLLTTTAKRLQVLSERLVSSRATKREINRKINEIEQQIARLAPKDRVKSVVEINLSAPANANATFLVRYAVRDAGWMPVYDAKLSLEKGSSDAAMEIVRKANVYQQTTESWENINLTLSTARLSNATHAPQLSPLELDELIVRQESLRKRKLQDFADDSLKESEVGASEPLAENAIKAAPVQIDFSGFQAEYKIAGKTSVSNNQQIKSVTIGQDETDVALSAHVTPSVDLAAYLVASFKLDTEASYLPGQVFLHRDGVYIGKGNFPLLRPGEAFELGFGQDDLIQIEREETGKEKGQSGFISTVNTDKREYVTKVEYRHDFPMEVKIFDRIPVANHEDITVKMTQNSTKPTDINVEEKRGILAWNSVMEPGEKKEIRFGYTISWPRDMQLSQMN